MIRVIKSILPSLAKPLIPLGNLLFRGALPAHCLLCGSLESEAVLCAPCVAELPLLGHSVCPQCAEPTPSGEICGRCLQSPPAFDATRAAFRYEFPVDQLIQSYKYGGNLALGGWLARQLLPCLGGVAADCVIPLPLHRDRLAQRGFNQAGEIARLLSKELGLPLALDACERVRATRPQAALAHDARAANIRHAFTCSQDLSGKRILLIDDVLTTGATLSECARVLKLHGASQVMAVVLARAIHH